MVEKKREKALEMIEKWLKEEQECESTTETFDVEGDSGRSDQE